MKLIRPIIQTSLLSTYLECLGESQMKTKTSQTCLIIMPLLSFLLYKTLIQCCYCLRRNNFGHFPNSVDVWFGSLYKQWRTQAAESYVSHAAKHDLCTSSCIIVDMFMWRGVILWMRVCLLQGFFLLSGSHDVCRRKDTGGHQMGSRRKTSVCSSWGCIWIRLLHTTNQHNMQCAVHPAYCCS